MFAELCRVRGPMGLPLNELWGESVEYRGLWSVSDMFDVAQYCGTESHCRRAQKMVEDSCEFCCFPQTETGLKLS